MSLKLLPNSAKLLNWDNWNKTLTITSHNINCRKFWNANFKCLSSKLKMIRLFPFKLWIYEVHVLNDLMLWCLEFQWLFFRWLLCRFDGFDAFMERIYLLFIYLDCKFVPSYYSIHLIYIAIISRIFLWRLRDFCLFLDGKFISLDPKTLQQRVNNKFLPRNLKTLQTQFPIYANADCTLKPAKQLHNW